MRDLSPPGGIAFGLLLALALWALIYFLIF